MSHMTPAELLARRGRVHGSNPPPVNPTPRVGPVRPIGGGLAVRAREDGVVEAAPMADVARELQVANLRRPAR